MDLMTAMLASKLAGLNPSGGGGGGGVTDYNKLKNRPVSFDVVEILPETTVEYEPGSDGAEIAATVLLTEGQTYTLKWNGVDYECVCSVQGDGIYVLGNVAMLEGGDTGEPFVFASIPQNGVCQVMPFDGSTSITLSITCKAVQKLDMVFLPEGYPYKETGMTVILPEMTVEGGEEVPVMTEIELVEGKTYTVKWNGTEYTCVAQKWEMEGATAGVVVGDYGLVTADGPITGDPFLIADLSAEVSAQLGGVPTILMCIDGSTSVTLSITGEAKVVHKMAGEYLPDGMPYAEPFDDVVMAAWPANVISSGGYEYLTGPVGKVVEGSWYKVTLGGVVYETIARRNAGNSGFVLGSGKGDNHNLLYGDFPFTIDIYDKPFVVDGIMLFGDIYLEDEVSEVSTDDFSVRGSLEVQEIHERCLPKTATPLIVRCDYYGVADVPYSVVGANALAGRAVYLYRFTSPGECDIYSLASVGTNGGGLRFASIVSTDAGWLAVMWAKWKRGDNITFGEHRLSTTTE